MTPGTGLLIAAWLCLPAPGSAAGAAPAPRLPTPSTVQAWTAGVERFFADPAAKAERLKNLLTELPKYDLAHPDVKAALDPLRHRLDSKVASLLPGGSNVRIGDHESEVERWAVLAGPLKPVLSDLSRRRVDAAQKSAAVSNRIAQITRALSNGNFGWEDPAPVVAALSQDRQQMYAILKDAHAYSGRVHVKDSRFLDEVSGRVENLRAEEGQIKFTVKGRRLELDDLAITVLTFTPGDLKKAEAALTAGGKALLQGLRDAMSNRAVVTVVVALVLREELRGTIKALWAEKGQVHVTILEQQPGGVSTLRDFAFSEIFGLKP